MIIDEHEHDYGHEHDRSICLIHNGSKESITIAIDGEPRPIDIEADGFFAIPIQIPINSQASIPTLSILASGIDGIPFPHAIPLTGWIHRRDIGIRGWIAHLFRRIHQPPRTSYRIGILEWNGDIAGARLIT